MVVFPDIATYKWNIKNPKRGIISNPTNTEQIIIIIVWFTYVPAKIIKYTTKLAIINKTDNITLTRNNIKNL